MTPTVNSSRPRSQARPAGEARSREGLDRILYRCARWRPTPASMVSDRAQMPAAVRKMCRFHHASLSSVQIADGAWCPPPRHEKQAKESNDALDHGRSLVRCVELRPNVRLKRTAKTVRLKQGLEHILCR